MTLTRTRPAVRDVPGMAQLPAHWRAALVVLCEAFPHDAAVWECVSPGADLDLRPAIRDSGRPEGDRVLLAFADGLVAAPSAVHAVQLVALSDTRLRLLLDALAIARGGLPID